MPRFLLFCRAGFENDAAAEADDRFAAMGWDGSAKALEPYGLVGFQGEWVSSASRGWDRVPSLASLIFCRQMIEEVSLVSDLPDTDRAGPIADALLAMLGPNPYRALILEHPDTNEGRALAPFCKKFSPALVNAVRKRGLVYTPADMKAPALHIVLLSYEKAYVGLERGAKQKWKGGIPRLKFPEDAPSRSTLKLEEAFLTLLHEREQEKYLSEGGRAVDLGASPGGWTYHLVKKGFYVTAVDNGPMDKALLNEGMVDHLERDAYHYQPREPVDLLVCDMIDQPHKVTSLIARWFKNKQCRWAVFNLKLPMKKRYEAWEQCVEAFWKESELDPTKYEVRSKHLYHNREEVTLLVKPK